MTVDAASRAAPTRASTSPSVVYITTETVAKKQTTSNRRRQPQMDEDEEGVNPFRNFGLPFGVAPPHYAHIPLILNADGTKMSKRDAGALMTAYIDGGYVPEAVQTPYALFGIRFFFAIVPVIAFAVALPLLIWYPITRKTHMQLTEDGGSLE